MKTILLNAIILIFGTSVLFAQHSYEKGYYIDNKGNTFDVFLKIVDFTEINQTDARLDFRQTLDGKTETVPAEDIREFGIGSQFKYVKATVELDDSNLFKNFPTEKEGQYVKKALFLNTVVEGDASLYSYVSPNGSKFFYNTKNNQNIRQLLYKKYLISWDDSRENTAFRERLFTEIKCEGQVFNDFLNVKYDKKSLSQVFENYNMCHNSASVAYKNSIEKKSNFNVTLVGSVERITVGITNISPEPENKSKYVFVPAVELEYVTPSERFAVFMKIDYAKIDQQFQTVQTITEGFDHITRTFDFSAKSISLVLGPRFYWPVTDKSKIFLGAGLGMNMPKGNVVERAVVTTISGVSWERPTVTYDLSTNFFFNLEAGYQFHKKVGVALNITTNKNMFAGSVYDYSIKYHSFGLSLRYTVL